MLKPKVFLMLEWFSPGYKAGGPIRSGVNLCLFLKEHFEVYVFTTNTDHGESLPYPGIEFNKWLDWNQAGVKVFYAEKEWQTQKKIKSLIKEISPSFIYINLFFSPLFAIYPVYLAFTKQLGATLILCPRGTLFDSALAIKKIKKIPLLKIYKWLNIHKKIKFHATSEDEAVAIEKFFPGSRTVVAQNLPDYHQDALSKLKKNQGELKCVFISRIVSIKNLLFFIDILAEVKCKIEFTIAGPVEDFKYWELCNLKIQSLKPNIKVNLTGAIPSVQIAELIKQHHIFVLPTKGENFGYAIFESLQVGRPVLISDQTPWNDVNNFYCGWALPLQEKNKFIEVINKLAMSNQKYFDNLCSNAWQFANNYIHKKERLLPYFELFS